MFLVSAISWARVPIQMGFGSWGVYRPDGYSQRAGVFFEAKWEEKKTSLAFFLVWVEAWFVCLCWHIVGRR